MIRIIQLVFCLTFVHVAHLNAASEKVLYCSDKLATGFGKTAGSYTTGDFKLLRFAVRVSSDFEEITIDDDIFACQPIYENRLTETLNPEFISCFHTATKAGDGKRHDVGGHPALFYINVKTMKYEMAQFSPFAYTHSEGVDNSSMRAGKCEDF